MEDLRERVSYLEGLAEGLKVTQDSTEGKVLAGVLSVLEAVVEEIEDLKEEQERFGEYLEVVDEDLSNLEDDYYFNAAEDDFVEARCPRCGETVLFEKSLTNDDMDVEITCPNCGEVVYSNDEGQLEIRSGEDELIDDDTEEEWSQIEPRE
ncbi:MAG TPA: AraC family transcriptional regulator [Bacillota bacterium]|jgi:ribosomal protein S27E